MDIKEAMELIGSDSAPGKIRAPLDAVASVETMDPAGPPKPPAPTPAALETVDEAGGLTGEAVAAFNRVEADLTLIKQLKERMGRECAALDIQMAELCGRIGKIQAPYLGAIEEATERVRAEVLAAGTSYKGMAGKVKYTGEYVRTTWDNKALEVWEALHPELSQFKKETIVPARVSVEVK